MTTNVDTNILQNTGAKTAAGNSAGALQKGGIGGQQGVDFIAMILSRLQQDGTIPLSAETSPSPSASAGTLKNQLAEIISQFGADQALAENAGQNAELFQNGTATPLANTKVQNLPAEALIQQIADMLQQPASPSANQTPGQKTGQTGLMNNDLLAQQLGLDPAVTDDVEIFAALQKTLSDLGIQLNNNGEPVLQNTGSNNPVQALFAHLTPSNAAQDKTPNASPALQNAAPETSPSNAQAQLTASPQADQDSTAETVTGEAFLLEQVTTGQNSTAVEAGVTQSFVTAETAQQSAQRSASAPLQGQNAAPTQDALQKAALNTQNNTPAPNGQPQPNSAAANAAENMLAQAAPPPSGQNGLSFGAGGSPSFFGGQNGSGGFSEGDFDSEMMQQLRQDNNQLNQRNATQAAYNGGQYRPGAVPQQAQIMKAVTLSMSRGANNAVERMSLQLEPAELGRVKIELKMGDDGMLKAHILAEKPDTVQMLQRDSSVLQKALNDAGLDVGSESFSFDLSQGQDEQLAEDRNSKEALFDVTGIQGLEDDDLIHDNLTAGLYGQNYIRPSGVNIYV